MLTLFTIPKAFEAFQVIKDFTRKFSPNGYNRIRISIINWKLRCFSQRYIPHEAFHGDRIYQQLICDLIEHFQVSAFVETGTYLGVSTEFVARRYQKVPIFSCEVNSEIFQRVQRRLRKFSNVVLRNESSETFLQNLLRSDSLGSLPLFFLDAHWYEYWPLADELQIINAARIPAIVIIDDFQVPGRPEFGFDVYRESGCNLELIQPLLVQANCYQILLPAYAHSDAFPIRKDAALAGHGVLFQNLEEQFHQFYTDPFVLRYYQAQAA